MTSSLVGSEMCIRDRVGVRVCWVWGVLFGWGPPPLIVDVVSWCVGVGAVSYTHLTLPTICSV
eukprot:6582494-Prorocentrum_lima.AAC.1